MNPLPFQPPSPTCPTVSEESPQAERKLLVANQRVAQHGSSQGGEPSKDKKLMVAVKRISTCFDDLNKKNTNPLSISLDPFKSDDTKKP